MIFNIVVAACDKEGRKHSETSQVTANDVQSAHKLAVKKLSQLMNSMGRNGRIEVEGGVRVIPV
jgi:hypothetical protein